MRIKQKQGCLWLEKSAFMLVVCSLILHLSSVHTTNSSSMCFTFNVIMHSALQMYSYLLEVFQILCLYSHNLQDFFIFIGILCDEA